MGYYVNPKGETKEQFLEKNGTEVQNPTFAGIPSDHALVVLVNNGWMTAAGIAYDEREFQAFTSSSDSRPKKFYHVPFSALQALGDPQVETALKQMAA